MEAELAMSADR